MKVKKFGPSGNWFEDASNPIIGEKLIGARYSKARRKDSKGRKIDSIVLRFAHGTFTIMPDPTGNDIELVAWFNPK